MAVNPLANVLRFGFTPRGSGGSTPPPAGTGYRHDPRHIYYGGKPYIRFGFPVSGASAATSGTLAANENQDTAAFAGNVGASGALSTTDTQDIAAFTGSAAGGVTGALFTFEAPDVAAFAGLGGNFLLTTDTQDTAAFTGSFVATVVSNPLGKLKMYTGSLGSVSNREDWIVSINLVQEDGTDFDLTGASIVTYVTKKDCPTNALLTASTDNGAITFADAFTFQWQFTHAQMQTLCPDTHDVFCRITLSGLTTQVISASVAITEGGPTP